MLDILRGGIAVATLGLVLAPVAAAEAGASPQAKAPTAPPGYKIVRGPLTPAPAGPLDSGGQVSCPAGTVVWGGGTAVQGVGGPTESINTSAPNGSAAWRARVNNTGVSTQQFGIDAICAKQPKGYTTTFAQIGNPQHTDAGATATCPANTVLLSGGVLSTSDSALTAVTSAFPASSTKFTAFVSNGTGVNEGLTVFAICGQKPAGYKIVRTTGTTPPDGNPVAIIGGASCPAGTSVIGGGVRVATPLPSTVIRQSIVGTTKEWDGEIISTSTQPVQDTTAVICAA